MKSLNTLKSPENLIKSDFIDLSSSPPIRSLVCIKPTRPTCNCCKPIRPRFKRSAGTSIPGVSLGPGIFPTHRVQIFGRVLRFLTGDFSLLDALDPRPRANGADSTRSSSSGKGVYASQKAFSLTLNVQFRGWILRRFDSTKHPRVHPKHTSNTVDPTVSFRDFLPLTPARLPVGSITSVSREEPTSEACQRVDLSILVSIDQGFRLFYAGRISNFPLSLNSCRRSGYDFVNIIVAIVWRLMGIMIGLIGTLSRQ